MKLVSALKEEAAASSLIVHVLKTEQPNGIFLVDVEGHFPSEPGEGFRFHIHEYVELVFPLYCYAQATQTTLATLRASPNSDHLQEIHLHLEEEYKGFRRDLMPQIQDFR